MLGRDADRIQSVADLRGMRIGIGPVGSGTEVVARQVLAQLSGLDLKVSTQSVEAQLTMLERGELDLAAMVIDADAQLLADAVRERKLQIVDIAGADALAHRLPFARAGRIAAATTIRCASCPRSTSESSRSMRWSSATVARASR